MRFLLAYRFLKSKDNSGFINTISKISVIGIILGLTVLITVISVMNGFEQQLKNKVLGFTSHITVYGENLNTNERMSFFDQLVINKDIDSYSVYFEDQALLISESNTSSAMIRAVDPELESNVNIIDDNIISGIYSDLSKKGSIILGNGIARNLNVRVGDVINVVMKSNLSKEQLQNSKNNYTVSAIYDVGLYEYNNAYAFISLENILLNENQLIDKIRLKLFNPLDAREFSSEFNKNNTNMYARDWIQSHSSLFTAISNEKRVMFLILILIVAIASFNIVSSLLMLVKNKEKEIAILKTLGASDFYITSIFLLQGIFLGFLGITLGLTFGVLLANNVNFVIDFIEHLFNISLLPPEIYHLSEIPAIVKMSDIRFVTLFSVLIILFSSLYPARKAASVRPADPLRGVN
tara:strand:+ start:884 stop:2107 length:1224 start_codon:yes stop_codon:yes gene_type:complete